MSRYTSDGRRRSSMAHARHPHYFDCGKVCFGNGYVLHRQSHGCRELTTTQWLARPAASPVPAEKEEP